MFFFWGGKGTRGGRGLYAHYFVSGKCQRRSLTQPCSATTQQVIFSVCGSVNASNNYKKGGEGTTSDTF